MFRPPSTVTACSPTRRCAQTVPSVCPNVSVLSVLTFLSNLESVTYVLSMGYVIRPPLPAPLLSLFAINSLWISVLFRGKICAQSVPRLCPSFPSPAS